MFLSCKVRSFLFVSNNRVARFNVFLRNPRIFLRFFQKSFPIVFDVNWGFLRGVHCQHVCPYAGGLILLVVDEGFGCLLYTSDADDEL